VAGAVIISAVPPLMVKTATNPADCPRKFLMALGIGGNGAESSIRKRLLGFHGRSGMRDRGTAQMAGILSSRDGPFGNPLHRH
jgi:hypothetical protein